MLRDAEIDRAKTAVSVVGGRMIHCPRSHMSLCKPGGISHRHRYSIGVPQELRWEVGISIDDGTSYPESAQFEIPSRGNPTLGRSCQIGMVGISCTRREGKSVVRPCRVVRRGLPRRFLLPSADSRYLIRAARTHSDSREPRADDLRIPRNRRLDPPR